MNRKGFTLIELMIVVAVLGILAAIAIPKFHELYTRGQRKAKIGYTATVKQYSADGNKIGEWRVDRFISRYNNEVKFTTKDDKLITVSGNFVIEE